MSARRPTVLIMLLALLGALLVPLSVVTPAAQAAAVWNWNQKSPATSPPARQAGGIAFDQARSNMVLFGGESKAGPYLDDTWTWDGTTWTQASPATSPSARALTMMAYDPVRQQTVLFGGAPYSGSLLNDTWVWDGTNWTQKTTAHAPSGRFSAAMAFDPVRNEVVLFGGYIAGYQSNETWVWDGTDWTKKTPATSPGIRAYAGMAFDPVSSQMVMFGGSSSASPFNLNDTWVWDGTNWTQKSPATSPSARYGYGLAYDPSYGAAVMFGGLASGAYKNETWKWDGTTWTKLAPASSPAARLRPMMAYDPVRQETTMFGGNGSAGSSGDLGDTWTWAAPATPVLAVTSVSPATGSTVGGTSITITGTEFAAGATVTVGGAACTNVVVVDATTITCDTPAGAAGTADVTVTNPDTNSATKTAGFTYVAPVFAVTSVSPATGSTVGGTSITITGTEFAPGATVTVGGAACTNVVVVDATTITCDTPAGTAGSADVTVTNPDTNSATKTAGYTYATAATTTISQVSATSITYGSTIGDAVTITAAAGAPDPTGTVTFYYCYDATTPPSACDAVSGTKIGTTPATVDPGAAANDGISTAALAGWTPASGAGRYLLHAVYSGDAHNDGSVDNGVNESFQVTKKSITVTPSGSTINPGATAAYPFTYSSDFVSPDTSASIDVAPTCGSAYAGAAGSYVITCSGGSDHDYDFTYASATLTVNRLKPSIVYTGQTFDADGGSTSTLSAQLSIATCGGTATFSVYSIDGVLVRTYSGKAVDPTTGVVTFTTPAGDLPFGIYTVSVAYNGSTQCETASDEAAISIVNPSDPNTSTTGGGYYKMSNFSPPRSNFGFTVQKVLSGKTLVGYKGQLLWMNGKAWRLKGTVATGLAAVGYITCPPKDVTGRLIPGTAKCVAFKGSGVLQKFNSSTGRWDTATQYGTNGGVTFTVTIYDGGQASVCKTSGKTTTCSSVDQEDWFGIQIDPVASTVLPETVPVSLRASGNNGGIQVR